MHVLWLIFQAIWGQASKCNKGHQIAIQLLLLEYQRVRGRLSREAIFLLLFHMKDSEIVDDGDGADRTAAEIDQFQRKNNRVSCRHNSKKLGLPSIPVAEAGLRRHATPPLSAFGKQVWFELEGCIYKRCRIWRGFLSWWRRRRFITSSSSKMDGLASLLRR